MARSFMRTHQPRVLRSQGRPRHPRGSSPSRGRTSSSSSRPHLARGDAFTGAGAFVELPPLSCGAVYGAAAITVDESDSALGQVLLIGGHNHDQIGTSSVRLVGLATGVCRQPADLPHPRSFLRRLRCRTGTPCAREVLQPTTAVYTSTAGIWSLPAQGARDMAWLYAGTIYFPPS